MSNKPYVIENLVSDTGVVGSAQKIGPSSGGGGGGGSDTESTDWGELNSIADLRAAVAAMWENRFSIDAKMALLQFLRNTDYFKDEHAREYYDEFEAALFQTAEIVSISAVFDQGSAVIYDSDNLATLRQYLTVTATYEDMSQRGVTGYTLSGTLTEGTSTITVSYAGKTTTFEVTVSAVPYLWEATDRAFDGGSIVTDVALLETDIDFTIAVDVTFETNPTGATADGNRYMLFRLGSNFTMLFGKNASGSTEYRFEIFGQYLYIGEVGTTRQGIVVTHAAGSEQYKIWWRKEGGEIANDALDNAVFSALTNPVIFGTSSGVHQLPKGVLNHALISPAVWSNDKINEFLDF